MLRFLVCLAFIFVSASKADYKELKNNPYVGSSERHAVKEGLMPRDHPIRPILDALFSDARVTATTKSLRKAGFRILKSQPRSFILVVKHPSLPGYLIKLHLDSEVRQKRGHPGWYWFAKRVYGAKQIARCIDKKEIRHFKVPGKWLYPLPVYPLHRPGSDRKNVVLVVEDMKLLSREDNYNAWKTLITRKHLDELYTILKKCGGSSLRPSNIPFSRDGKIAFIDTEYPGATPRYSDIRPYLSRPMQAYWDKLTQ